MIPRHSRHSLHSLPDDMQLCEHLTRVAIKASEAGLWAEMVTHLSHAAFAGMMSQGVPYERARALVNQLPGFDSPPEAA